MQRTFAVFGDSISTFEGCVPAGFAVYYTAERAQAAGLTGANDTWWSLVARRFGGRVAANASYSGSMVAGEGFPAGWTSERTAALAAPAGEKPTDVLVFMGTNDYGWGSARAQAAGRSAATPACVDLSQVPEAVVGAADEAGLQEFAEAYGRMLDAVRTACPGACVWCVPLLAGRVTGAAGPTFAWNLRGVPMRRYNETIAQLAAAHGCRFADAAAFGLDYEAVDGTHPTRRGMAQLAELVACAMEGADQVDPAPFEPEGLAWWASRELCAHGSCVGCEHARGTGNAWYCVCEKPW